MEDCTKSVNIVGLVLQADEEVHNQLAAAEVQPFFALGWFITWFAHSVDDLQHVSRLFDLFMASHPLMPLYVTAVVIKVQHPCCLSLSVVFCACTCAFCQCRLETKTPTVLVFKHPLRVLASAAGAGGRLCHRALLLGTRATSTACRRHLCLLVLVC